MGFERKQHQLAKTVKKHLTAYGAQRVSLEKAAATMSRIKHLSDVRERLFIKQIER